MKIDNTAEKKDVSINIKVTEKQYEKMKDLVEKLNYASISELIRRTVLMNGITNNN